jgi:hypothetical protein
MPAVVTCAVTATGTSVRAKWRWAPGRCRCVHRGCRTSRRGRRASSRRSCPSGNGSPTRPRSCSPSSISRACPAATSSRSSGSCWARTRLSRRTRSCGSKRSGPGSTRSGASARSITTAASTSGPTASTWAPAWERRRAACSPCSAPDRGDGDRLPGVEGLLGRGAAQPA